MERNLAEIQQYLNYLLRPSAEQLHRELQNIAASLVERRKQERGAHTQIVASLKTPVRREMPRTPKISIPNAVPLHPPAFYPPWPGEV